MAWLSNNRGFVFMEINLVMMDMFFMQINDFESTQCFKPGDHVSFTLDCDHSVLEYFINGTKIKDLTFGGNLAKFKDQLLYPAFGSCYQSSQMTITFID